MLRPFGENPLGPTRINLRQSNAPVTSEYPILCPFFSGENGPNCMTVRAMSGDPSRCYFRWLLDTDIKGWIPQKVIDATFSSALTEYLDHLRAHVDALRASGAVGDFLAREEGQAYASLDVTGATGASVVS